MSPITRSLLLVLAFLAAAPDHARGSSQVGTCLANQGYIEKAKQACGIVESLSPGEEIKPALLAEYTGGKIPRCPSGGIYTIGRLGEKPACSIELHSREGLQRYLHARRNKALTLSALALIGTAAGCMLLLRYWYKKRPVAKSSWKRKLAICVAGYVVSGVLLGVIWSNSLVSAPIILQILYLPFAPDLSAPLWL